MKTLKDHIDEALKMGKNLSNFSTYSCQPADKKELKNIIDERIPDRVHFFRCIFSEKDEA